MSKHMLQCFFNRCVPNNNAFGLQLVYNWSTTGLQLVYNWSTIGLQLVYNWSTIGLQLVYNWSTIGLQLVYDWRCLPKVKTKSNIYTLENERTEKNKILRESFMSNLLSSAVTCELLSPATANAVLWRS